MLQILFILNKKKNEGQSETVGFIFENIYFLNNLYEHNISISLGKNASNLIILNKKWKDKGDTGT